MDENLPMEIRGRAGAAITGVGMGCCVGRRAWEVGTVDTGVLDRRTVEGVRTPFRAWTTPELAVLWGMKIGVQFGPGEVVVGDRWLVGARLLRTVLGVLDLQTE